jgi:RNA polymerase-associated protein CTR9
VSLTPQSAARLHANSVEFGGGVGRPPDLLALVRLHSMLAHFHLARARSAPRTILPHSSTLARVFGYTISAYSAEYDKLPQQHLKEYHYTEAAANLNKADNAHTSAGGSMEDEPAPLSLGKSASPWQTAIRLY